MFKLFCFLNFVILVTSNPLQGITTCPVIFYQQKPEVSNQAANFNPYHQQNTVQNQLPSYQTIPYLYNDQIKGLYLDKVLTNPSVNTFVDPNTGIYNQNGYTITRYVTNPGVQPNVVNNYIIVPPEYLKLNQSITNVLQTGNKDKTNKYMTDNNKGKVKSKREDKKTTNNNENKIFDDRYNNHDSKIINKSKDDSQVKKKKRKSSNNNNVAESHQIMDANIEMRPKNHRTQRNLDVENNKNKEEYTTKKDDANTKRPSKKKKRKKKNKSKKTVVESQCNDEVVKANDNTKDVTKNTADDEVDFDIYEDCACPANRRIRNNCCHCQRNNHQQCYPRDFTENIVSYLNSLMSNPQFGANYFNSFANMPYFNYLYQTPQQPIKQTNDSNKNRKNKRKKQKSNKNDSHTITVKPNTKQNQDQEVRSNNCEKVIELEPQFIEIEETKEPPVSEEKVNPLEQQDELVEELEAKELEIDKSEVEVPEITEPVILYADEDSKENLLAVAAPEDVVPFLNYNDIIDDYYPDFTSDNIYLSNEEDCDNFHDRHYYTSDNKAEMSRERRRYERLDGKKILNPNDILNDEQNVKYVNTAKQNQRKDNGRNIENSSEARFRVPPPLEFPDFKTEMVNKDRFVSPNIYYDPDDNYENYRNSERYYGDVKPFHLDVNKAYDKEVETVFAHSKVVRYGAKPDVESSAVFDWTEIKNDDRNLFSSDGETTVILARSMGYPEDYF